MHDKIGKETTCIRTPLEVTMSYFNAISYNNSNILFSSHGVNLPQEFIDTVGPDETTIFFLMAQYLKGDQGFWYPYLRTLPQPGHLSTPLYYDDADEEDLEWLAGTSLEAAREQRLGSWKERYSRSFNVLFRDVGWGSGHLVDQEGRFTW